MARNIYSEAWNIYSEVWIIYSNPQNKEGESIFLRIQLSPLAFNSFCSCSLIIF